MIRSCCRGAKLNKDGGYAWVILTCAFFTHSLTTGFILATVGNLTIAHKEFFNISIQQSSSIGSVCTGTFFLFGPVASVIVKFTKSRLLQIIGGSCMVLGLGLSAVSSKPWHAYLLYGILMAVGSSCCVMATLRILAEHFNRRLNLALSVASMGIYAGMMTWPVGSETLFSTFGYSKAMGILASVLTVTVVAGTLYFEPTQEQEDENGEKINIPATEGSSCGETQSSTHTAHQYTNEAISSDSGDVAPQALGQDDNGSPPQVLSADVGNPQEVRGVVGDKKLPAEIVCLLQSAKLS